ncbi:Trm112 family protein [Aquitalea aquatilis]|uniref:Trm112 family protein n=1 Tax=Aquitalea aquatilis TaxID=1537400 RepID=UPI0010BD63B1|nr:Trm112 family protein [Aquitalea aquatilis]
MDAKFLDILVCPLCKGPLVFDKAQQELICKGDRLAFPVGDGIPMMLETEARELPPEEEVK